VRNADGWLMHGLLKEFFYSRQPEVEKRERHKQAAEYYKIESHSIDDETELAYHMLKALNSASALRLMVNRGYDWLKQGYQDEILQLFTLLPDDNKNDEQKCDALMLKGAAMEQIGDWRESENVYSTCKEIATEKRDSVRLARCMRALGVIYYRRGDLQDAMVFFEKAREMISKREEPNLMAHIQSSIGVVRWRLGEAALAKEAYEEDLNISKSQKNSQGMVRALNNLGILDWQAGKYDAALERYAEALKLAERMEDKKLVAVLYSNIADAYKHKGEKKEARRFYERCLELSEELRFNWQTAEAYRCLAEVAGDKREKYLQKALHLFDKLGAKEDARLVKVMMR
jgi:tetratricopeptide (TPR) repeat protein